MASKISDEVKTSPKTKNPIYHNKTLYCPTVFYVQKDLGSVVNPTLPIIIN